MRLAASCTLFLHATGRQLRAKPLFFESMLPEELFELKNEETIKKFLRTYATYVLATAYPSTLCTARSNLVRQFLKYRIGCSQILVCTV
jgi:hypothetical protein